MAAATNSRMVFMLSIMNQVLLFADPPQQLASV
jgi:hypothetical protein